MHLLIIYSLISILTRPCLDAGNIGSQSEPLFLRSYVLGGEIDRWHKKLISYCGVLKCCAGTYSKVRRNIKQGQEP